jgi:hypothetical protein
MIRVLAALVAGFLCLPAFGATCKIREYTAIQNVGGQSVQVALEPAVAQQEVTFTTSVQSAAFNNLTAFVFIVCDALAHFEFGADPEATASDAYIPANTIYFPGITTGVGLKVAFYDGSSS